MVLIILALLYSLYLLFTISCSKSHNEGFVIIPGSLTYDTCLATCSGDSQCLTALYNDNEKRCSVAKEFETPDEGEVAYVKLDIRKFPQTFIRSDTEERVNLADIGAVGQGLPIDWGQESALEKGATQADFDRQYGEFINQRKQDDIESGFVSDIDIAYGAGESKEGMKNLCVRKLRNKLPWPLEEPSELAGAITGTFLVNPNNSVQYLFSSR
jgi:hypothetical protein